MFSNISYKQKLQFLGVLVFLALIVCYQFAIKKTMDERKKYLNYTIANYSQQDMTSMEQLRKRETKANLLYNQFILDTLQPEKNLLSVVSNFSKLQNLNLKEYKSIAIGKHDSIQVLTRLVTVEGSFNGCLKLLYELERSKKVGKISSAEFKSYLDAQDKSIKLDCSVYVQNIISY